MGADRQAWQRAWRPVDRSRPQRTRPRACASPCGMHSVNQRARSVGLLVPVRCRSSV